MEVSVIAEAKESKTVEIQNQAHADCVLRRERNHPHGVLDTGSDSQPACLQRDPAALALFKAREEARVVAGQRMAASPGQRTSSQCPEHPSVPGREKRRRAESSSQPT